MINFEYTRVSTVKDAVNAISKIPTAGFIAGGTNLVDLMKKGVTAPTRIIDINNLPLIFLFGSPHIANIMKKTLKIVATAVGKFLNFG